MSPPPTVFVVGATGTQGGAVARQLRGLGWNVRATTRKLDSDRARALTDAGVQLTQADWDDGEALAASMAGCDKLFLVLVVNPKDPDSERRHALRILDTAKQAGLGQVVSCTSLGVSRVGPELEAASPVLHHLLSIKKTVEQAIADAGLDSYTLLRPAYLMANFVEPAINAYSDILEQGTWTTALAPESQLGLLDHEDTARVALAAFRDPARFHRRVIGMASELRTAQQTLDTLGAAMGRSLTAHFMTEEQIAAEPPWTITFRLNKAMRNMADDLDLEALAEITPLTTFEAFLERERDQVNKF